MATIIDPLTGKEAKKPICDIAASHMARKTFIGNLYKKVRDPNLVGSLTGHVEGSRAFARYRNIDEEVRDGLRRLLSSQTDKYFNDDLDKAPVWMKKLIMNLNK